MVSWVWKHFVRAGDIHGRCNVGNCGKVLTRKGGNTKGLASHLASAHKIFENGIQNSSESSSKPQELPNDAKKQKTMLDYGKYSTLEETVSSLASEAGLTIKQIAKTSYIRKCLLRDFPLRVLPKNQSGMMKLILNFYKQTKEVTINKIKKLIDEGKLFSTTLDEWTSLKNFRYLNVNLHYNDQKTSHHINLGMIPIPGSCPSHTLLELVSI